MSPAERMFVRRRRPPSARGICLLGTWFAATLTSVAAFLPPPPTLVPGPSRSFITTTKTAQHPCATTARRSALMASAYAADARRATPPASLAELSATRGTSKQRFVFFGGKGGVGKTSTSAAMAVYLADEGLRTLVISTDPAHSLGDVLDQKLSGGQPMPVLGMENLWAMEVDASRALERFKAIFEDLDLQALTEQLGAANLDLGLDEITGLLENPPPGIDELIALADVVQLTKAKDGRDFDRIVIDTAPTGHTLRLLSFPDFLDSFLGKIIKFQVRLSGLLNTLSGMFGGAKEDGGRSTAAAAEATFKKIEAAKERMVQLRDLFRNSDATEFCIVTIPTQLAVAETRRLLSSLQKEGIAVRHMVVNKLVEPGDQAKHVERILRGQSHCITRLEQGSVSKHQLSLLTVPYFDVEIRGVYGLKFMADSAFGNDASTGPFPDLFTPSTSGSNGPKFVVMGGKGGVGKTSSSAALAVKMAEEGLTTIVVSTDPAHSLGDALDMDLSSGKVTPIDGLFNAAPLYALEVDTEEALEEFKEIVRDLAGEAAKRGGDGPASGLMKELSEFAEVLDNVPPGSDELVALATVVKLVKEGSPSGRPYDRVVIDTAPTGHTLRLLSFPEFLEQFFERLMVVRDRLGVATSFLRMFGGGAATQEDDDETKPKRDRLKEFQFKMIELDDLLHDPERTEFVVVTIPTEMAVAETERLVEALKDQDVAVRRVIVNQVLKADVKDAYWDRLRAGQSVSLREAEGLARGGGVRLTKVPFFDTEMRSVYALRVLAKAIIEGAEADVAA